MFESLKAFFRSRPAAPQPAAPPGAPPPVAPPEAPPPPAEAERLRLAACALLLELAHADDEFSLDERQHLENAVRRHFGLDEAAAAGLLEQAERSRRGATDLWQFTNPIREGYSLGQKMVLAEAMWGLVFADGELSSREDQLMRKVSYLLGLEMAYLSEARRRVRAEPPDAPGTPPVDGDGGAG